ncbi:MAG: tRNA (adenosine(37)-N6)-threonylcarbamoyltransferase complex dimerization subunit type 1 TsaB [Candidatus Omnitrophota bacterium]
MKILSIDTSSSKFSIAIGEDRGVVDIFDSNSVNQHSTELVPRISELLKKNSWNITEIDLFCVGVGPGSFTGLRVGVATMRGFAFALGKRIAGIPSVDAVAWPIADYKTPVCVMVDAKRENVYARFYNYESGESFLKPKSEVSLYKIDELMGMIKPPIAFVGDGLVNYRFKLLDKFGSSIKIADPQFWYPRSENLIKVFLDKVKNKQPYLDDVMALEPYYIYPKDCQIRKK